MERFLTLRNLVFSRCVSLDVIRCGNKFGMNFCLIGVEAMTAGTKKAVIDSLKFLPCKHILTFAIYFFISLYYMAHKKNIRYYRIDIDGNSFGGEYLNILIANQPYYGKMMRPAADARPDDGFIDIYLSRPVPFHKRVKYASDYIAGRYTKWPQAVTHYRGKRVSIVSDMVMPVCLDGEMFFDTVVQAEAVPHAADFTGPIDAGFDGREP
jgi:diacylglycerol kinase family enzyme